jgi:nitrile hydratase accessory protein
LFHPDDPLAPQRPAFKEVWHAQVLALADTLVKSGHFSATDWAEALGAALKAAEAQGAPDNEDTYYSCALAALEQLSAKRAGISQADQAARKQAWEAAYRRTPHGKPVML